MKRFVLLFACLAITQPSALAGELFRWIDKAGRVHYSDVLPADAADVERRKLSNPSSQTEDLPYETQRAQQNFPVALYVTNGCGAPCDQARSMLSKRGIPFSEKILTTQEEVDSFYKISGSNGAPTLAIGKLYLSGFQESKWNSELDVAGYPKTASYRQRVTAPPAGTPAVENPGNPAKPAAQ